MSEEAKLGTEAVDCSAMRLVGEDNAFAIEKCAAMIAERLLEDKSNFESEENYDRVREAIEWDIMALIEWIILHPEYNRVETLLGAFIGIAVQYNHREVSFDWRFDAKLASMFIELIVDDELEQAMDGLIGVDGEETEEKPGTPASDGAKAKSN